MRGNIDDNHTDMGHIVHYGLLSFIEIALLSQSNHSGLSAIHMLIIQIQPHSPQNTHAHILNMLQIYFTIFLSKKPIA